MTKSFTQNVTENAADNVYTIQKNDCPWKIAEKLLKKENSTKRLTTKAIIDEMNRLAQANGCTDTTDFQKRFFLAVGSEIQLDTPDNITHAESVNPAETPETPKAAVERTAWRIQVPPQDSKELDEINNLPTDKERVIEWHKRNSNTIKGNYVIVDKKACSATVYSADGTELAVFETGLAARKGDQKGQKGGDIHTLPANQMDSFTTAGEYTISDPGNSEDVHNKFNDNVFDLKGFGYEQGNVRLAIHQIPTHLENTRGRKFNNNNLADNRMSYGCVNLLREDFERLKTLVGADDSKLYILPEEEDNKLMLADTGEGYKFINSKYEKYTPNSKAKPLVISSNSKNVNKKAKNFASGLMKNKEKLMTDLRISNETYDKLALLALGIGYNESKFGDGKYWGWGEYDAKEAHIFGLEFGQKLFVRGKKWWNRTVNNEKTSPINSRGLTQMKLESYTDKETRRLLDEEWKITGNDLRNPEKSATATMIVLAAMYKNELPALKEQMTAQNISEEEALLYLWLGKRTELNKGIAAPDKKPYVQNAKTYINNFNISRA